MLWKDKINNWIQTYPKNIKKSFFYETCVCNKAMTNVYKENFIESDKLNNLKEDYSPYQKHINKSKNKYVTSFPNLSGDTMLVIPMPKKNKPYTTMKEFIDNASPYQQKVFWKKVATEVIKWLRNNDIVYISTHGLGVSYFHLRIEKYPKYYQTKEFIAKNNQ